MMTHRIISFAQARARFIRYGRCFHQEDHLEVSFPYNCGVKLVDCKVCGERISEEKLSNV